MIEWLPIETAPKDGTLVEILFDDGEVVLARTYGQADNNHNDWWAFDGLDFGYGSVNPINWRPRAQ